jgi:hypothetical protein
MPKQRRHQQATLLLLQQLSLCLAICLPADTAAA